MTDDAPPGVRSCPACNGTVSLAAAACPHCGHPNVVAEPSDRGRRWGALLRGSLRDVVSRLTLLLAILVGLLIYFGNFNPQDFRTLMPSLIPGCDTAEARSQVDSALANAPFGKVLGLSVVEYRDAHTVYTSETQVFCEATVTLNNTVKTQMSYSFELRDGKLWVKATMPSAF